MIWMRPYLSNVLFDLNLLNITWKAMFQALNSSHLFKLVSGLISKSAPSFSMCCIH